MKTKRVKQAQNKQTDALLRLHEEPCAFFTEKQIHRALMKDTAVFMEALERFYLAWKKNRLIVEQPTKQLFTTKGVKGDLRVMPCVINRFERKLIKAVKIIGTNEEERVVKDKISVGKAVLIHPEDNFVQAVFDVCALSSFRTAAISILALKHTVCASGQRIGLIGAGRIGYYEVAILYKWLGVKEFYVWDTKEKRTAQLKRAVAESLSKTIRIVKQPPEKLCSSCTALFLATTSALPVLNAGKSKNVQFISSVGADADNLSELERGFLKERSIISESRQNIHFGDLKRWHRAGLLEKDDIIELISFIGKKTKCRKGVLFISTGTAVQDAFICQFLFDKLNKTKT